MPLTGLKGLPGLGGLSASGSGYGSVAVRRPSDLAPFMPSDDEIQRAVEQRTADDSRSWVWDIFDIPSKVLGAYSIRGAIAGAIKDGPVGALQGAGEGYAWLTDLLGITDHRFKAYTTRDIRIAAGDDQSQEGFGNFVLNLAGDIASDPFTWIMPFGKIGEAAKAGKAIPGLQAAIDAGQRATLALKFPGFSAVPLVQNLGLRSMNLTLAHGLDALASWLRTNKVTGSLIRGMHASFPAVKGAAEAVTASKSREAMFDAQDRVFSGAIDLLTRTFSPEARKLALNDGRVQRIVTAARELGISKWDDAHTFEAALSNPTPIMRKIVFDKALKDDPKLAKLWQKATEEFDPEAVDRLYRDYTHEIPQSLLDMYGYAPRPGIEVAAKTVAEGLNDVAKAGKFQTTLPKSEAARLALGGKGGAAETAVRQAAGQATIADLRSLLKDVKDGKIRSEYVQQAVDFGNAIVNQLGDAEVAQGILNSTLEFYVPRNVTPAGREWLHSRFMKWIGDVGGDALNITASFMRGRKFPELTTFEVNALLRELGSKVTNYMPIREIADYGAADGILGTIFNKAAQAEAKALKDPELLNFLSTNPMWNDFRRIEQSAKVQGGRAFWEVALHPDSPFNKAAPARMKDLSTVMDRIAEAQATGRVAMMRTEQGVVKPLDIGHLEAEMAGKDFGLRHEIMRDRVRSDWRRLTEDQKMHVAPARDRIMRALKLTAKDDLGIATGDLASEVTLKRTLRQQVRITEVIDDNRAMARELEFRAGGPPQRGTMQVLRTVATKDSEGLSSRVDGLLADASATVENAKKMAPRRAELAKRIAELERDADAARAAGRLTSSGQAESALAIARREHAALDWVDRYKGAKPAAVAREMLDGKLGELREAMTHSKDSERALREALSAELNDLRSFVKSQTRSIGTNARQSLAMSKAITERGLAGGAMAEAIRLNRVFREEGLLSLDTLDPETIEKLSKSLPDATLHLLDPEDAKGLISFWKDQNKVDMLRTNPLMQMLRRATQVFNAWTVTNPLFPNSRVRDMVTGFAMLHQAGATPLWSGAASQAFRISRAWQKQLWGQGIARDVLGNASFKVAGTGREWKLMDVLQLAQSKGLVGSGMARDEVAQSIEGFVGLVGKPKASDIAKTFWRATPEKNAMLKAGYQVAQFGDDWVRMAGLIDRLKAGLDVDAAVDFVRKWTYNPARTTTTFERAIVRPVIPFQQFLKWSIGRTAEMIVTRPVSVTWVDKVRTVGLQSPPGGGSGIDAAQMEQILPEFIREGLGIPYKNGPDGPRYFLLGGYLPAAELGRLAGAVRSLFGSGPESKGQLAQYFMSNLNPYMKEAIEQATNHDYFTNQDIEQYPDQMGEMFGVPMSRRFRHVLRDVRFLSELDRLNVINLDELRAGLNAVERGTKLGSREELPMLDRFLGSAFGVTGKTHKVDPVEAVRDARRANEAHLSDLKGKLRFALENASSPAQRQNVAAVTAELRDVLATKKMIETVGATYDVPTRTEKKRRLSMSLAEGLRK